MLKQMLVNGAFKFGTQLITLFVTILIAREMGASVVGELNYAISLIAIFKSFVVNSLGSTNISMINKNHKDLNKSQNTLVSLTYITYTMYAIIISVYAYVNIYESNYKLFYTILILIFAEFIGLWFTTSKSYFNATIDQFKASFPEFIRISLTKSFQIITIFIFQDILGLALSVLISTIISLPILFRFTPKIIFKFPSKSYFKNYLKKALQFTTFTLNKLVPQQLDKIFLESSVSFGFIGYYVIAQKFGNTIEIIAMSMGVVLFPFFTKLGKEKDVKKTANLVEFFLNLYFNFIGIFLFVLCFFAQDILIMVFGNDYQNSTGSMIIYIILGAFSILLMPFNNVAIGFGDLKKITIVNISSFLFFFLSAFLITKMNVKEQIIIELMSLARLLPYVILLLFFVTYSSKLLECSFYKVLILISIHILLFSLFYFYLDTKGGNKFFVLSFFVIIYFVMNNVFGFSTKKTISLIKLKLSK